MNVRKNIGFPLLCAGHAGGRDHGSASRRRRSCCASTICSTSPVSGLAGGDRQRVALGRAIVRRPKCFLMDEPLGTLDTEFRDLMFHELRELHNRIDATTVYVTHDQLEAMSMADKIAVMNHGVIEQFGTPQEIYDRPATMFVADFIGSPPMNFLPFGGGLPKGAQRDRRAGRAMSPCRRCARTSRQADLALGVRPEHIRFDDASKLRGAVYGTEYLGTTQIVTVETADGMIKARVPADVPAAHRRAGRARASTAAAAVALRQGVRAGRSAPRSDEGGAAWLTSSLSGVTKRFGDTQAVDDLDADHRRRRVRRAARPDRRRQDDDAAPRRRPRDGPTAARSVIGGRDVDRARAGRARRRLRLPAIFALSASDRVRQPRLPAALAGAPRAARTRSSAGSTRWRGCCASTTSWQNRRRSFPAARCSASRSAGRWCASRRSI